MWAKVRCPVLKACHCGLLAHAYVCPFPPSLLWQSHLWSFFLAWLGLSSAALPCFQQHPAQSALKLKVFLRPSCESKGPTLGRLPSFFISALVSVAVGNLDVDWLVLIFSELHGPSYREPSQIVLPRGPTYPCYSVGTEDGKSAITASVSGPARWLSG